MTPSSADPLANFLDPEWRGRLYKTCPDVELILKDIDERLTPLWRDEEAHPPNKDVFRAFCRTPFESVKIVIVGRDPYPDAADAMGLAFSVPDGRPITPSLRGIHRLLEKDLDLPPRHTVGLRDLTCWADQGVLLLNCALTCGRPSHLRLWKRFIDCVLELLADRSVPIAFLFWGSAARSRAHLVRSAQHFVRTARHPAAPGNEFLRCRHFAQTNTFLGDRAIAWYPTEVSR
jgi:uracil-DNA glycosylase